MIDYSRLDDFEKYDCKWLIYDPLPGTRTFSSAIFWGEVKHTTRGKLYHGRWESGSYSKEWGTAGEIRLSRNKKIGLSMVVSHKYVRLATDAEIVLARMTGEIE